MVATSSRNLSCGVWLMLILKMSAPASNSLRIIALSEEAGPSVARILIRRSRLMAWVLDPRADRALQEAGLPAAHSAFPARCLRDRTCRGCPARAVAPAAHWP